MTTDLERTLAHFREMAAAEHVNGCGVSVPDRWGWKRWVHPNPECGGCADGDDRALWAKLAAEVETYLGGNDDDETLEGL